MTVNKRSRQSRQRGSHTHGWGSMKKHRGAGNRGGRGMAGGGKRADSTKPSRWKNTKQFGKHGFTSLRKNPGTRVNVSFFEDKLQTLLHEKKAREENGMIIIDARALGIAKVLGSGAVKNKFRITVDAATTKAIETIAHAGGEIVTATA